MKKLYVVLIMLLTLPLSGFSSNSDVVLRDGSNYMSIQEPCGQGG